MRQKLHKLKVLKKQITHADANGLLKVEGFDLFKREIAANIVSIAGRQRRDREEIRHHRVETAHAKRDLEKRWPFELAAKANKGEIREYLKPLSKNQRKKARRYFRRCHAIAHGIQWRKSKPKRKRDLRGRKYTYAEYIHSPEWYDRRNRYYRAPGRKCGACGSSQKLHLHHMIYTDFDGTEPDAHLVPLCETHHDCYHALYRYYISQPLQRGQSDTAVGSVFRVPAEEIEAIVAKALRDRLTSSGDGSPTLSDHCAYRKSNPNILMVQSAQDRSIENASGCLDGT